MINRKSFNYLRYLIQYDSINRHQYNNIFLTPKITSLIFGLQSRNLPFDNSNLTNFKHNAFHFENFLTLPKVNAKIRFGQKRFLDTGRLKLFSISTLHGNSILSFILKNLLKLNYNRGYRPLINKTKNFEFYNQNFFFMFLSNHVLFSELESDFVDFIYTDFNFCLEFNVESPFRLVNFYKKNLIVDPRCSDLLWIARSGRPSRLKHLYTS